MPQLPASCRTFAQSLDTLQTAAAICMHMALLAGIVSKFASGFLTAGPTCR